MNRFRYVILRVAPRLVFPLFVAIAGVSLPAQDIADNRAVPSGRDLKDAALHQMPSARERLQRYILDAYGPEALLAAGIAAATDQSQNAPPEWKQGTGGFARRFGSRFGQSAIAETARDGLSALLDEDTRYHRCECGRALPRLGHALLSSVTARSANGHRVISMPDLVAPYTGALVATSAWYPGRFGPKDGFRLGTWALGIHVGVDVVREFLPHRR